MAVHVPKVVREALRELQFQLQGSIAEEAVRWTPFEQLHLTLEFLGNVEAGRLADLQNALSKAGSARNDFRLSAESIGAFSSIRNPRVIWAGISGDVELLCGLQADIRNVVEPWIQEPEERKYRPHLTLGRVRPLKPRELRGVSAALAQVPARNFGEWRVEEFALMQSKVSPHGAQHSVLATFPLQHVER